MMDREQFIESTKAKIKFENDNKDIVILLDEIYESMEKENLSIFAGAGLSVASGYVDWQNLMSPIRDILHLNSDVDLTELAQFYMVEYGNKQKLNDLIYNEFNKTPCSENKNAKLIAKLPIKEYWTTNYDDVIERELREQQKEVDVIIRQDDIKYHNSQNSVVLYKMHGDKKDPDSVVLTKEDYQNYDLNRGLFTKLLSIALVSRTFLFIGFSFKDPNLERILNIAKNSLPSKTLKKHYCFMRKVQEHDYTENKQTENDIIEALNKYEEDLRYQSYRVKELNEYGINTIMIDDFKEINLMLTYLYERHIANNVFIAGGINPNNLSDYGDINLVYENEQSNSIIATTFLTKLGEALVDNGFQIYTGYGAGVGNYILFGALYSPNSDLMTLDYISNKVHISNLKKLNPEAKQAARERIIENCSSTIFLFCNSKERYEDTGYYEEYEIAKRQNKFILPVSATGNAASDIFNKLDESEKKDIQFLGPQKKVDVLSLVDKIIGALIDKKKSIVDKLKEGLQNKLNADELQYESTKQNLTRVFISYHYEKDFEIAKAITNIIDNCEPNLYSVVKEERVKSEPEEIKGWISNNIKNTKITILLISNRTLDREYVRYELEESSKNNNILLPVVVDREEDNPNKKALKKMIAEIKKYTKEKNLCLKYWYKDKGENNVLNWIGECVKESKI